jgi:hypothetical protein
MPGIRPGEGVARLGYFGALLPGHVMGSFLNTLSLLFLFQVVMRKIFDLLTNRPDESN